MTDETGRQQGKAICLLLLYGTGGIVLPQIAVADSSATVTVKVTVVAPPACVINDNKAIAVEFGNVMMTRLDGSQYRRPVNYTLDCRGAPSGAMRIQIQGNGAAFDGSVLQTSTSGLGIRLQQGSAQLAINSWLNFTYPQKPTLWAIPIKQPGVTLTGGDFTAVATMKVDYP